MTNDIWWSLSPIFTLSRFFGLFVFEYPSGQPNVFLTVLYTSTLWLVYRCIMYYGLYIEDFAFLRSRVNSVFYFLNEFIIVVTIIRNIYYDKKIRRCLKRMNSVDDSLQKIGVPKEYSKLRKYVWSMIALWGVLLMILDTPNMVWLIISVQEEVKLLYLVGVIVSATFHLSMIMDIIFWIILRYMGLRFDQLNECILKLIGGQTFEDYSIQKTLIIRRRDPYIIEKKRRKIWTAMHVHLEMCSIVREVSTIFGPQVYIGLGTSYTFLPVFFVQVFTLFTCYKNYVWVTVSHTITLSLWTVVYILRIYMLNYLCEDVSAKGNAIRDVIHKLKDYTKHGETRKEIMQFVLQIVHKPLTFSGGYFKFGYETLHKFITFALTVITIILQMNSTQITSNASIVDTFKM